MKFAKIPGALVKCMGRTHTYILFLLLEKIKFIIYLLSLTIPVGSAIVSSSCSSSSFATFLSKMNLLKPAALSIAVRISAESSSIEVYQVEFRDRDQIGAQRKRYNILNIF